MANLCLKKRVMGTMVIVMMCCFGVELSNGALHNVGDSSGWTTIGNVNYKQWAVTKSFQVGDIILFQYNPQFHNVMQVTHKEYKSCNTSSPIATHTTGNDSITITTRGHHYFLCGVPGHCQGGQKVDINVPRLVSSAAAPTPSALSSPKTVPPVPTPSPSTAPAPLFGFNGIIGNLGFAMALLAASLSGFA